MRPVVPYPIRKTPNLPEIEARIAEFWRTEDIFAKSLDARANAPRWVFYEGPPSANGPPGIHHLVGRTLKDLYCRYKGQAGFRVDRRAGWDTHGLPVELNVEKALGISKEDIGTRISIEEYNQECRKAVMRYADEWRRITERIGFWLNMDDAYITYDPKYVESVWWSLQRLFEAGYLYRGFTVQPYSPMAGTGLSSHELNQPGAYREVVDLTLTVMLRVRNVDEQHLATQRSALGATAPALAAPAFRAAIDAGDVFFLAWTTTPWTLPSNTALAINAGFTYSLVETFDRFSGAKVFVVLAEGLLDKVFDDAAYERTDADPAWVKGTKRKIPFRVVSGVPGSQLVGLWYEQLLPWASPAEAPERAFRVIAADFVSMEDGTGIVHIAPTFGADDAMAAKRAGVPPMLVRNDDGELVPLVDLRGRFVSGLGAFSGKYVKAEYYSNDTERAFVDEEIAALLQQGGRLFSKTKYAHTYPHCWRTDTPLLYYPLKSWFVRTTAAKDDLIRLNKTIHWHPPSTGEGRFGEWLEKLSDWNLSRSRFWGVPLPLWVSQDGTETRCIGSYAELAEAIRDSIQRGVMDRDPYEHIGHGGRSAADFDAMDVHRPRIDQVKLVSPSGKVMLREPEVIDVWFDSGAMPFAQVHYPFENRDAIDGGGQFPADFICEGVDQTRGWFFTLHALSTMLFGKIAFANVVSHGLVLDAEGRKMSKRLGNAIDPVEMLDRYGADAMRWYMVTNGSPWQNLRFDTNALAEVVRKFFVTLWSTYSFFATYANVDEYTTREPAVPLNERTHLDRWIVSELQATVDAVRAHLEAFDATRAFRLVQAFVIDSLSNWYVRLNRRRFWKSDAGTSKLAAYQTLHECLITVSQLIAPIAPFQADQLYRDLTARDRRHESVHLTDFPRTRSDWLDAALNQQMDAVRRIVSLALSLRKDKSIKVRQPLPSLSVIADDSLVQSLKEMRGIIGDEVNVKAVEVLGSDADVTELRGQLNFRDAGPRFGNQTKALAARIKELGQAELRALNAGQSLDIELNGSSIALGPELVKITAHGREGMEVASEGGFTVVLDTHLNDQLRLEGMAREVTSAIQRMRKNADLEITTRIRLVSQKHPALEALLNVHGSYIFEETLSDGIDFVDTVEGEPTQVDGVDLHIAIRAMT